MNRRAFLTGAAAAGAVGGRGASSRPNVLFLFTDDQRADTIGALGNRRIKTPNLDSLAHSGLAFRHNYCLGGNVGAVCLPSRNMLLSGRAYFRFGMYASGSDPNFADSMKEAGYVTYHHGKLGNSAREIHKRFDFSKYVKDFDDRTSGEPGREIVDDAIAFLRSNRDARPFFMYLAFANPHDPRIAKKRYLDRYRREDIPLPTNYLPVHPFDNGEMTVRDELLAPWPRTEAEVRKQLHEYYAVITGLDHHIGRLLAALKELRLYDATLIVFSSDNGLALGSHGLMGKQSLYEHSTNVPLFFSGPGIRRGRTEALCYLMDIYPTVLDLVGARIPDGLDAKSLKPVIEGRASRVRDVLFTAYRDVQRAIRDERWKLIRYPQVDRTQLFDLQNDPYEVRDLSADPRYRERIRRMMAGLEQWQKRLGDSAPLRVPNPRDPSFHPPQGEKLEELKKRWKM